MTYWLINAWFLLVVAILAAVVSVPSWRPKWLAALGAFAVVGLLTAIFDNAIIGFGIVDYDSDKISGIRLGFAPIEDFAYTLAACVLVPAVFTLLTRFWPGRRSSD